MIYSTKDKIFLIADKEKGWIYCATYDSIHAQAISSGLLNSSIHYLSISALGNGFNLEDLNSIEKTFRFKFNMDTPTKAINEVDNSTANNEWYDRKKLAILRSEFLGHMVDIVEYRKLRASSYPAAGLTDSFLYRELDKCDPENNYYSPAVQEWAHISDIPFSAAYDDITMRLEGYGLIVIRTQALFLKYSHMVNQCTNRHDAELVYNEFFKQSYLTSNV